MDDDMKTMGKPWENGDLYSNQSLKIGYIPKEIAI